MSVETVNIVENETTKSVGLVDRIYENLSANPYFSAGAGLVGIGLAASIGKRLVILSNTLFRRKFVISLSLNNDDA